MSQAQSICCKWGRWDPNQYKMSSYQYRKSHCGDKTVVRSSYLHNGISYTGKTASLYWIRIQVVSFYWLFTNFYSSNCFIVKHCMVFKLIWMSQNVIKHHYRCSLVICLQDTHVGKHLPASSELRAFLFTFLITNWWTLKDRAHLSTFKILIFEKFSCFIVLVVFLVIVQSSELVSVWFCEKMTFFPNFF